MPSLTKLSTTEPLKFQASIPLFLWDQIYSFNVYYVLLEVLCPRVYEINASKTSVEELLLERKILEEKINEIRANRVDKLLNKYNKPNQEEDEEAKKERTRKGSITVKDTSKEYSQKEKEYNEQRLRLQNETLKKQLVPFFNLNILF